MEVANTWSAGPPSSYRVWWRGADLELRGLIVGSTARYPQKVEVGGWVAVL